jgi:hypothetical protein
VFNDEDGANNEVDDDRAVYRAAVFPDAREDWVIPSQNVNDNKTVVHKDEIIFGMSEIHLMHSAECDVIFLSRWMICWIAN